MKSVVNKVAIASTVSIMLLSVAASSWAADCSGNFKTIKSWINQKPDNTGKCHMENVPNDSEYPADSIPYKLRNGKELCPKHRYEMDWEYLWENGKRVSGIYHLGSKSRMTLTYKDSFTPIGPVLIYRNEKLFCEVPINKEGKPDGIVKEYSPEGKLAHGFRMADGKRKGGFVEFDKNGGLKSFACEESPVFDGDQERCGFNGKSGVVELKNGTILTHVKGRLTAKETTSADGSKSVIKFINPGTNEEMEQVTEYGKNGKLYRNFSVKNKNREGKYLEYSDNGKLVVEREYKEGVPVVEKSYYLNGKLKEHSTRQPDNTSVSKKGYWDNGQLQSEGVFAFKREGYYGSSWTDIVPVGKISNYAENGSLSEEAYYDKEGKLDGVSIFIDEKGKRTEAVYLKGILTAKKIFSPDNKLELEEEYYEDGSRK